MGQNSQEGGFAFDYLTSMEDYIKNIIQIGGDGLLSKKVGEEPLLMLVIKSLLRIFQIQKNEVGDIDAYVWIAIINTLLEEYPGKLDSLVVVFIKILVTELSNQESSKSYRLHTLQLLSHLFIYNAELTLKVLAETNTLGPLCSSFFSSLLKFTEVEQLRCLIYGIVSLLKVDFEKLPDLIKGSMGKILEILIRLMKRYEREKVREKIDQLERM